MIKTDKYKPSVIAITRRVAALNPLVGDYDSHYLNEKCKFVIRLSNGVIEAPIYLVRDYEKNPDEIHIKQLHKVAITYKGMHRKHKLLPQIDNAWKNLFAETETLV